MLLVTILYMLLDNNEGIQITMQCKFSLRTKDCDTAAYTLYCVH